MPTDKDTDHQHSPLSKARVRTGLRTYMPKSWERYHRCGIILLFVASTLLFLSSPGKIKSSLLQSFCYSNRPKQLGNFHWTLRTHGLGDEPGLCEGMYTCAGTRAISHSGYIGLEGDSENNPKRSFYWFFEAQNGNKSAPVILTMGGGPGVSGMLNTLIGQAHCRLTANGTTEPNPHAWTENFHLIALDHPVNVGFSYGARVHNSRDAADDVYDFLQKFYVLFPYLVGNPLVLSGGSYGGTYIPHIATVIHQSNLALASPRSIPSNPTHPTPINLDSLMLSNPHTDALSHYTWSLHYRCTLSDLYIASVCASLYTRLPTCLDGIRLAYQDVDPGDARGGGEMGRVRRVRANEVCQETQLQMLDGRAYENVDLRCNGTHTDCLPELSQLSTFLNAPAHKEKLGVPPWMNFSSVNQGVHKDFIDSGDIVQPAQRMYPPLIEAGVKLLHYVGKLDANCPWPGTLSMLTHLQTPLQASFLAAPDLPWAHENATVRSVPFSDSFRVEYGQATSQQATSQATGQGRGKGRGKGMGMAMAYVAIGDSGHMVVKDTPALAKKIVDRWVLGRPFN